ncbi:MAG: hypothetical protein HeimC3_24810 [Candidatus Heimdallarchaeota archaeon LC_3]|nr:MAG: hypothetical protein HeimC3_24810 [Candidatus Heimdallarchaeota archaeon LC_3]
MKFSLNNTNLVFLDKDEQIKTKKENFIRKIFINTMIYEFEPKSINPPATYVKDRYSVEIKPVNLDFSSEEMEILKYYKFLNENHSLLEHKSLRLGTAEGFITKKFPVKIARVKNLVNFAFRKNILF